MNVLCKIIGVKPFLECYSLNVTEANPSVLSRPEILTPPPFVTRVLLRFKGAYMYAVATSGDWMNGYTGGS